MRLFAGYKLSPAARFASAVHNSGFPELLQQDAGHHTPGGETAGAHADRAAGDADAVARGDKKEDEDRDEEDWDADEDADGDKELAEKAF